MTLAPSLRASVGALALLVSPALAQDSTGPSTGRPGSLLVFPVFDTRTGVSTALTVTNTNLDRTPCGATRFRSGDVWVHYVYVSASNCTESDRIEQLTPGDTLCVNVSTHALNSDKGWAWVEALDPGTGTPIDYDFLIGNAVVTNGTAGYAWEYTPYSFRCRREEDNSPFGESSCGYAFAESSSTSTADFDGFEYDLFPQTLLLPRFLGEGKLSTRNADVVSSRLYLMSEKATASSVDSRFFNNNETMYSRNFSIRCWLESALSALNGVTRQENLASASDPSELGGVPYGWLKLDGHDGILGCCLQLRSRARGPVFANGGTLQWDGTRSDVQFSRPRIR